MNVLNDRPSTKLWASPAVYRRSSGRTAARSAAEGIDRVCLRTGPNAWFQGRLVHDIHGTRQQVFDQTLQTGIGKEVDRSGRVDLDQDVGVAIGARISAGAGSELGGVADASGAQRGLVFPQPGYDRVATHGWSMASAVTGFMRLRVCGQRLKGDLSGGRVAPVHQEALTGDVGAGRACEEHGGADDVRVLAEAAHGCGCQ